MGKRAKPWKAWSLRLVLERSFEKVEGEAEKGKKPRKTTRGNDKGGWLGGGKLGRGCGRGQRGP